MRNVIKGMQVQATGASTDKTDELFSVRFGQVTETANSKTSFRLRYKSTIQEFLGGKRASTRAKEYLGETLRGEGWRTRREKSGKSDEG